MNREQIEHVIRAASAIAQDDELIIVGSQAILGQYPDAPPVLLASNEVDLYPKNFPDRADLIDGAIGEGSPFHEMYGYYAQGVGPGTAILPAGWEQRLVPLFSPLTRGATGWCLEAHDLFLSKLLAGREKDLIYVQGMISAGLVNEVFFRERFESVEISAPVRELAEKRASVFFAARLR
ncbi:MAG: hypothetical protein MUF64_11220 [Polyangiaceae bacterium]|nr:hypothetical protein [Polyangiaceae bacterium]